MKRLSLIAILSLVYMAAYAQKKNSAPNTRNASISKVKSMLLDPSSFRLLKYETGTWRGYGESVQQVALDVLKMSAVSGDSSSFWVDKAVEASPSYDVSVQYLYTWPKELIEDYCSYHYPDGEDSICVRRNLMRQVAVRLYCAKMPRVIGTRDVITYRAMSRGGLMVYGKYAVYYKRGKYVDIVDLD